MEQEQLKLPFKRNLREDFIKKAERLIAWQYRNYGRGNSLEFLLGDFDGKTKEDQQKMFETLRSVARINECHAVWD